MREDQPHGTALRVSCPFDLRFRASLRNAILNMLQKERTRRRLIPTVPIGQEPETDRSSGIEDDDGKVIEGFRDLVRRRLGDLGVAVLDARLAGEETKSLADSPLVGNPGENLAKRVVFQIKELAREYGERLGNPGFLRDIERAMGRELATVQKRRAAMAARRAVGA
jgi:hypothetical protein